MPNPNKPVPGPVAHATDPLNLALIEIDKDIAKLQAKRAELIEKLRQVHEYDQEQKAEHKQARKQQAHERGE
jgi:uncharacterized coiled-coil protein SlyX